MRLALLVLLAFTFEAFACSCLDSDLQGQFDSSRNVFTAVVTGARFDDDGNIEADFEVTEIFKGEIPFEKLRTTRSGSSCDTSITVGPEYIFFMDDSGRFGMCSGNKALTPGRPTPWLDLLRAYKAGETPDLSSPWKFGNHDGSCSLKTDFRSTDAKVMSYLSLEHRYAAPKSPVWAREELNKPGYSIVTFALPTRKEPEGNSIVLRTRNREFVAVWSEDALPHRIRGAFQLKGDVVIEFAQELLLSEDVELEGSLKRFPTLSGSRIRTTNAGDAIAGFIECSQQ